MSIKIDCFSSRVYEAVKNQGNIVNIIGEEILLFMVLLFYSYLIPDPLF